MVYLQKSRFRQKQDSKEDEVDSPETVELNVKPTPAPKPKLASASTSGMMQDVLH